MLIITNIKIQKKKSDQMIVWNVVYVHNSLSLSISLSLSLSLSYIYHHSIKLIHVHKQQLSTTTYI